MAHYSRILCRMCSPVLAFMLLLQAVHFPSSAQDKNYNFSKVDDWLKNNLNDLGGRAVLVIYKDGRLIYNRSENNLNKRQKTVGKMIARRQGKDADEILGDFTSTTKERIASCSKWLSAALVMTFIDDGSLKLEDTVGKFLPVMSVNGKGNITVEQCLSHRTGIKTGSIRESNDAMKDVQTMDQAIERIANLPMEGMPGQTFHYSSAGLQVAAAVIEKISGKNFETLFAERIAGPCNMRNTDFGKGKVPMPAGSGWSTAEDYAKFLSMILNEGNYNGRKVLSKNAVIEMQKNRISSNCKIRYSPAEAGKWGYGFGEWVMDDATNDQRSDAVTSPGLFGSFPWVDNKNKYAGFLMTFNLKNKGRNEKYKQLKTLIDAALNN